MILLVDKQTRHINSVIFARVHDFPLPQPAEHEELVEVLHDGENVSGHEAINKELFEQVERGELNLLDFKLHDTHIEKKEPRPEQPPACFIFTKTVIVDVVNFVADKEIRYYVQRCKSDGLSVSIGQVDNTVYVFVFKGSAVVSEQRFIITSPERAIYHDAVIFNKISFPHYLGLYNAIEYLKQKQIASLDLMFLMENELDTFKKKWGQVVQIPSNHRKTQPVIEQKDNIG